MSTAGNPSAETETLTASTTTRNTSLSGGSASDTPPRKFQRETYRVDKLDGKSSVYRWPNGEECFRWWLYDM